MYAIENGFNRFYWGNNLYDEAEWFVDLLHVAQNTRNIVRKELRERKSKN